MKYQAVLDAGAVAAYARGSVDVGEVLAELAEEESRFAVPALALFEVASSATKMEQLHLLQVLASHPAGVVVPFGADDWRDTAAAMELFDTPANACAALLAAYRVVLYVVTPTPAMYEREGLVVVPVAAAPPD